MCDQSGSGRPRRGRAASAPARHRSLRRRSQQSRSYNFHRCDSRICDTRRRSFHIRCLQHTEVAMSFPGISAPTNPLAVVGAGQPVPNSDPPRDEIDRRLNRPARVERPPRVARVTLLTRHTSGGRQPIQRKALITVAARPAASRPGVPLPIQSPTLQDRSSPSTVRAQGAETDARYLGATVRRRPLPGRGRDHHPSRSARRLARRVSASTPRSYSATAEALRDDGSLICAPHAGKAASSDADQGPARDRVRVLAERLSDLSDQS